MGVGYFNGWGFRIRLDGKDIAESEYNNVWVEWIGSRDISDAKYNNTTKNFVIVSNMADFRVNFHYGAYTVYDMGINLSNQWNGLDYTYINFFSSSLNQNLTGKSPVGNPDILSGGGNAGLDLKGLMILGGLYFLTKNKRKK